MEREYDGLFKGRQRRLMALTLAQYSYPFLYITQHMKPIFLVRIINYEG